AGGSIWIDALSIAGTTGSISADGGNSGGLVTTANGGGGSGGRIAVSYTTNTSSILTSTNTTATGGTGFANGGNGSIYDGNTSATYMGGGYGLAYFNNSNSRLASNDLKQYQVLGIKHKVSENQDLNMRLLRLSADSLAMTEKGNPGIFSTIKFYLSNFFSQAKNIFDLAFSIPSASAATVADYTSPYKDTTFPIVSYTTVSWNASIPSGATLQFQIRTAPDSSGSPDWTNGSKWCGPTDCAATAGDADYAASYYTTSETDLNSVHSNDENDRYIQYKAWFDSGSSGDIITLTDITINYSQSGYPGEAFLLSSPYKADVGIGDNKFNQISWNELVPGAAFDVKFQVRTAPDSSGSPDWTSGSKWCGPTTCADTVADDSYATTFYNTTKTGESLNSVHSAGANDQWLQYKIWFIGDGTATSKLYDVSFNYFNTLTGNFTSSSYNTEQTYNVPYSLSWNQTLGSGNTIKFQIATSADGSSWTSFYGPAGTTDINIDFYSSANAVNCSGAATVTCNIPPNSILSDGYSDQYIKYKTYFTSAGTAAPTITSVTFEYKQNTAPTAAITSASQGADGTITVNYNLSDIEQSDIDISVLADIGITLNQVLSNDTAGGTILVSGDITFLPASGTVQVENELISYTGKGSGSLTGATRAINNTKYAGHASGTVVWIKAATVSGAGALTGITATPAAKSAIWTAAANLPNFYSTAAKIRVTANDREIGNPTGTGDSGNITIDTKVPAYASYAVKMDVNAPSGLTMNISAAAGQTAAFMRFSNANDLPAACTDITTPWEAYTATKLWSFAPPDANGVYMVYWQFKDDNCNMISGYSSNPAIPVNMKITDISAVPASKYRDIFWWDVVSVATAYNVWRCEQTAAEIISDPNKCDSQVNYGGTSFAVITTVAGATNYCFDEGDGNCADNALGTLIPTTKYFYKVTAENINGVSGYSATVSAIPDGSVIGESNDDVTPPSLTVPPTDTLTTQTGTTIGWTTDEASYSLVKYGTNQNNLNLIAGNATESMLAHSVALSNLASGTLYYYQILSADAAGNLLKSPANPPAGLYTFTTLADSTVPSIVGTPSVIAGQVSATISWTTSEASTSQVKYIEAVDNTTDPAAGTATSVQSELVTNHIVIIPSGLTPDTIYNYQVLSNDASANNLTYQTVSPFDQFNTATTADITAPTLDVAPADTGTTQTTTTIGWTTNENSYSVVKYGANQNNLNLTAGAVTDSVTVHSVAIASLTPGSLYYYQIFSADSSGNLLKSPVTPPTGLYTFTAAADSTPPSLVGTPAVTAGRDSATVSWVTDEPSSTRLRYVVAVDNATAPVTYTDLQPELVTNHFVILTSLASSTTYNFQIISADASANTLTSPSAFPYLQFTTEFDKADPTAPIITFTEAAQGPSTANSSLGDTTASAIFSANENAFFSVIYQPSATPPASYSKETGYPSLITFGVLNTVTMEALSTNTKYYYKLRARDLFGNVGESVPYFFTTTIDSIPPAAISDLAAPAASIASTSLTLTWIAPGDNGATGTATSYDIRYSTVSASDIDTNWNAATQIANEPLPAISTTAQSMTVTGLTPSTSYYFAIKTSDEIPNVSAISNIVSAATPAQLDIIAPVITNVTLGAVGTTTAIISWDTDKNSSSLIDYGLTASYGFTQGSSSVSTKSHTVNMAGLAPNTKYYYRVKSIDSSGNAGSKEDPSYFFTTQADASAGTLPIISSIASSGIAATSATITWTTSVNADSTVGYSLDKTYGYETGVASNLTSHTVTLTSLAPSSIYYYRVKSRDGNQLATDDNSGAGFTFTTLAGTDNIPPIISNVQISTVTANKAIITWTTNENSNSYVEFGTVANIYTSVQGNPGDSLVSHSVQLISLTPLTPYYFQVKSTDAAGNRGVDNNSGAGYTFSTTAGAAVDCPSCRSCPVQETLTCPIIDTASPIISDIKVSAIDFNAATITWTTDEASSSMVGYDTYSYDIKGKYAYSSGNSKDSVKSHSVTLNSLDSASTYYFRVLSTDLRGNTAESQDQSFKTPAISESKDKGAATVDTLKKEFESIAKTLIKDKLATEENIKELLSRIVNPPIIGAEGPNIKDIRSYGATVYWQTDRRANSIVKFTEEKTNSLSKQTEWTKIGDNDIFSTKHEVALLGLVPATKYSFQAQSQDILGNTASSDIKSFTTASASSIFNVLVSDLNLTSAKISWETANISTSSLEYGPTSNYGNYQENKDEQVRLHSIILTNLAPSSVFHFRVRSTEDLGTILVSDDYSFSTPSLPEITKYTLSEVKDNSIALAWTSNIPINSNVRYTNAETSEVKNLGKEEKTIDHAILLASLEAGKTYKIEIQGRDDANNLASVPAFDVQTGMDVVPPEISQVRSQSAVLSTVDDKVQSIISWKTNELSSTKVLWDMGGTKGDTLANESALDANLTTNHIVVLTQFKPGTVYRFRVASTDKFGNTTISSDYTILAPIKRQSIIQMIINQFENIFGWARGIGR
ncbi:MAG: fibronectin type III domain-containing protein, partial [bacterium]|nr:fibronectin type III domain-containing protein [bacterium]